MKITTIVIFVIGIALLTGLFLFFKPQGGAEIQQPTQETTQTEAPKVKTFELVIKNKKIVLGPETIKVTEGDEILLKITSDEAEEEFHIHAYDHSVELRKDEQVELRFTANVTGRFPFELEKSKTDLGALEVSPKQ